MYALQIVGEYERGSLASRRNIQPGKTQRPQNPKQTSLGGSVCCFLGISEKWKSLSVSNCLWPHGLHSPWNSPGQNTGMGSLSLLQGIFPTQGSNPGFPHCRWILSQLSHKGNPRILERAAYPFLQWLFPTQELNWGLLHCRWILYQLSYQGSLL